MRPRRRPRLVVLAALPLLALAGLVAPSARAGLLNGSHPSPAGAGVVTLAGRSCRLIAVPTAAPVGLAQPCPGVRPGAAVLIPSGSDTSLCTLNFMWKGSDGSTYMGTAGHCVLGETPGAERTWAAGRGPAALDGDRRRIGEFAYAVLEDQADFALIRLDPATAATASPQMCHFGGPTGVNADQPGLLQPTVLEHFGQGVLVSAVAPGRSQVAAGMPNPDAVAGVGVAAPGDSGAPVISADGRAVGVLVAVGVGVGSVGTSGIDTGAVFSTRLAPQIARASSATGVGYTLQTAPPR